MLINFMLLKKCIKFLFCNALPISLFRLIIPTVYSTLDPGEYCKGPTICRAKSNDTLISYMSVDVWNGTYLKGTVLSTSAVTSVKECQRDCLKVDGCYSMNFNGSRCELVEENRYADQDSIISDLRWVHLSIRVSNLR